MNSVPKQLETQTEKNKTYKYKVDREIQELPTAASWHHRPVFFATGDKTTTSCDSQQLPIDEQVDFEGELFKGRILMRIRGASNTNSNAYFKGKKRTKQIVIQGRFKERISCGDVWFGDSYEKPLNMHSVARFAVPIVKRLVPGIVMDIASEKPRIMVLLGSESRTLAIDNPGEEPDLKGDLLEDCHTERLGRFKSTKHRRNVLRKPAKASKYFFDPKYVYTFQLYDDIIDISDFSIKLPFARMPLLHYLNYQPFAFTAMTKDRRPIFSFRVFHEKLLQKTDESRSAAQQDQTVSIDSDSDSDRRSVWSA
jgi:hypothetical protein